ncbi:MAG TPA: hypothetical protein VK614_02425 [Allosphingosinicella sp.]|nr:hypothetical protein [Allosphingosinicella sp.]
MTLLREQLVRKALAALSEIADECGDRPARKTLSLRFLLMYTFAASGADPKLKWIWDSFWTEATTPKSDRAQDAYIRGTGARSALAGICREVGYPPDVDFLRHLERQRDLTHLNETCGRSCQARDGAAGEQSSDP